MHAGDLLKDFVIFGATMSLLGSSRVIKSMLFRWVGLGHWNCGLGQVWSRNFDSCPSLRPTCICFINTN